jgi:hypothetical protein
MIEIYSDTKTNLSFSLDIENNQEEPKLRFVLNFDDDSALMFPATRNGDKAEVTVPKLNEIMRKVPDNCKAELEAIVDGTFFIPWEDDVQFKNVVAVSANLKKYSKEQENSDFNSSEENDEEEKEEDEKPKLTVKAAIAESALGKDLFEVPKPVKKEKDSDYKKFMLERLAKK